MRAKRVSERCQQEFESQAVRKVRAGQTIAVVVNVISIPTANQWNWVRQAITRALSGAGGEDKAARVSP